MNTKYLFLLLVIPLASCTSSTNKTESGIVNQPIKYSVVDLEGIWGQNIDENAEFFVKSDSLYPVEYQDSPIHIKISNDTLFRFLDDWIIPDKIIKLNSDSLILMNEFGEIRRHVKFK